VRSFWNYLRRTTTVGDIARVAFALMAGTATVTVNATPYVGRWIAWMLGFFMAIGDLLPALLLYSVVLWLKEA
jgi:uncharacterized membrane protein